jgi:transcriptional regulator with XRE-family HTH domain
MDNAQKDARRVGEKLRRIREKRGQSMSVASIVRRQYGVKLDPSYLSRMERGKTEIPLRTLLALADFYDVDPGFLVRGDGGEGSDPAGHLLFHPDLKQKLDQLLAGLKEDDLVEIFDEFFSVLLKTTAAVEGRGERLQAAQNPAEDAAALEPFFAGEGEIPADLLEEARADAGDSMREAL